jgi:DNA-binding response OmpR family regulator
MRILVAEDDAALASFVKKGLESEHYAVGISADGEQARAMAGELDFDLVVLDLNLPRLDGVAILRYLRTRKPSMPILVLTGRNRVEDRVQCLDLGADDYLGKPFSFTELSARIRALMGRSHLPAESVLAVDDLKLDRVERRVERAGRRIELTSKEFCLLEYLMRNAGRRITRAMIIEHVWNLSFDTCTNVVDVYVNYLRHPGSGLRTECPLECGVGCRAERTPGRTTMNPTVGTPATLPDCEPRRLASDLFHALSQPLTILCCSLELTLHQTPTAEQYRESVIRALAQAEQISWLVTGLRGLFDPAEAGEGCEVLHLQAAVHDSLSDWLPLAESTGVRICYLPRSACPGWFEAQRLRRGLFHLLGFVVGSGGDGAVVKIELAETA